MFFGFPWGHIILVGVIEGGVGDGGAQVLDDLVDVVGCDQSEGFLTVFA
jgi:hypothetical protein